MFCLECGEQVGQSQKFCGTCGKSLTASTVESQSKRKRSRLVPVMLWSLGIIFGLWVLSVHTGQNKLIQQGTQQGAVAYCCKSDTEQNTAQNSPSAPPAEPPQAQEPSSDAAQNIQQNTVTPPAVEQTMPDDERKFIDVIAYHKIHYGDAPNEFQKSTVRRQRAEGIARILPSRSVKDWIGQVSLMQTTSDERGILSIKLPGSVQISVGTMNNGLSDIGEHTLIPQGSTLYNQVAGLAVGDDVTFSGIFSSRDLDYVEEVSLTEEGSMTEPDFIFTFASVSKGTPSGAIGNSQPGNQAAPDNLTSISKAAEQGDVSAQYKLGELYQNGQGAPQDYVQAVYWYRKAAEQGDFLAHIRLGGMYALGRGVAQDNAEAYFWLDLATSEPEWMKAGTSEADAEKQHL